MRRARFVGAQLRGCERYGSTRSRRHSGRPARSCRSSWDASQVWWTVAFAKALVRREAARSLLASDLPPGGAADVDVGPALSRA